MIRMIGILSVATALFIVSNARANTQESIHVACDGCSTYQQYRSAAIRATSGLFEGNFNVEVSNVVQREIWDFEVFREREPNGVWLVGAFGSKAVDERLAYLDFFVEVVMSNNRPVIDTNHFNRWNVTSISDLRQGDWVFHSFADARANVAQLCQGIAGGSLENLDWTRKAGNARNIAYVAVVIVNNGDMFVATATATSHTACQIIDESAIDKDGNRIDPAGNVISGGGSGSAIGWGSLTYLIHMGGTQSCARWESDGLVICTIQWDEE